MNKILVCVLIVFQMFSEEKLIIYNKKGLYGFINDKSEIKIEAKYNEARNFKQGLALVKENNLYGFINDQNNYIIKNKYKELNEFYEERASFKGQNGLYGYINLRGEVAIEPQYLYAGNFNNSLAVVKYTPKDLPHMQYNSYIKKDGNLAFDIYENENLIEFSEGIGQIVYYFRFSAIDINGENIYSKTYDDYNSGYTFFSKFSENRAFLRSENDVKKAIIINREFKQIANIEVDYNSRYKFINGKCIVYINENPVLIDTKGKILRKFDYENVILTINDMYIVESNKKYGVLDNNFNFLVQLEYDYLGNIYKSNIENNFIDGLLYFEKGDKKGYFDEKGNVIIDFDKLKKVISDISTWSHPIKDIFNKYKIKINKVELVDKYPVFYVSFGKVYSKVELDKIISELLKANGYWNFEIKDELTEKSIKIYGDKKNKKLLKYEYE